MNEANPVSGGSDGMPLSKIQPLSADPRAAAEPIRWISARWKWRRKMTVPGAADTTALVTELGQEVET